MTCRAVDGVKTGLNPILSPVLISVIALLSPYVVSSAITVGVSSLNILISNQVSGVRDVRTEFIHKEGRVKEPFLKFYKILETRFARKQQFSSVLCHSMHLVGE